MKIVRVNVTLEFETNFKNKDEIENYLHNLNEDMAELPGFPQIVDVDEAVRDVQVEDMEELFEDELEDEDDFLFEDEESEDDDF